MFESVLDPVDLAWHARIARRAGWPSPLFRRLAERSDGPVPGRDCRRAIRDGEAR